MKPKFIIINAASGSGKDEFVNLFKETMPFGVVNLTTISPVENAMNVIGIEKTKDEKWRCCASEMKQITDKYYNISIRYILKKISLINENSFNKFIFIHCREPKSIQKLKEQIKDIRGYDCYTLFIERDLDYIPNNKSDMNVSNYSYDYSIENNSSLSMLKRQAEWFLSEISGDKL